MADRAGGGAVLRILLGTRLRRLREARGITASQAACAIGGSASKISRIELGRTAVQEVDIADLLSLYQITDMAQREELLGLAAQAAQVSEASWWHQFQDVLPQSYLGYLGMEASAESIRSYDGVVIPGPLRTMDYGIAAMAFGGFAALEPERLDLLITQRQRALESARMSVIVDEAALRRRVGSDEIMNRQLQHLCRLCELPGITLQIARFAVPPCPAPRSFKIFRFTAADLADVVCIRQLTGPLVLGKPDDVTSYAGAFDTLSAASPPAAASRQIIQSLIQA